ncbi:MAG TPA: hypothetical protein VL426_07625 [Candidatus Binatia bacterium]|nr:hypothetical protein [Candidatus Binatia bacterium]
MRGETPTPEEDRQAPERQPAKEGGNERRAEQKGETDIEKEKQDYVKTRVDFAMAESEYDGLIQDSLDAADRLANAPDDVQAKVDFWKVQEDLDKTAVKRDALSSKMGEIADRLIMSGDEGPAALKEALSQTYKELASSKEYKKQQAENYASLGLDRMSRAYERSNELQEEAEALKERFEELKEKKKAAVAKLKEATSVADKEQRIEALRQVTEAMNENSAAMEKLSDKLDELSDEMRSLWG